ncbi:MAG: response regulator [Cyanobacteria bacterium CRU_2_1]|nr:response regulator [Cyanobacteria bacterium CRU_2_1]
MDNRFQPPISKSLTVKLEDITLPTQESESNWSDSQNKVLNLCGLQTLVVDNDVDTRDLLSFVLQEKGAEVIGAASTSEAISATTNWYPDVLICDICLPDEDGYTLLRKVRALEAEVGKQIPAIAITGLLREEDCPKIVSEGFQKYLPKPTDLDELVRVVAELVGRK